jgi:hypothetical protein
MRPRDVHLDRHFGGSSKRTSIRVEINVNFENSLRHLQNDDNKMEHRFLVPEARAACFQHLAFLVMPDDTQRPNPVPKMHPGIWLWR